MFKNKNTQEFARQVFLKPTEERSIREIARIAGISPTTAAKICKELEKQGIIKTRDIARSRLVTADLESSNYKFYKALYNIESLKGLLDDLASHRPLAVILYGSYSRGEDTEQSDIDIAIIGSEFKLQKEKHEKALNRRIHIVFFQSEQSIPPNIKPNILNGKILTGGLT